MKKSWSFKAPFKEVDIARILSEAEDEGLSVVEVAIEGCKSRAFINIQVTDLVERGFRLMRRPFDDVNAQGLAFSSNGPEWSGKYIGKWRATLSPATEVIEALEIARAELDGIRQVEVRGIN